MSEIPASIKAKIRRYEPINMDGVTLYPVTVDEYDIFNQARPAIEFVQQSLPVAYVSTPLLQAFYAIDMEGLQNSKLPTGMLARSVLFLALALRVGRGEPVEDRLRYFKVHVSPNDAMRLTSLSFTLDGEERYDITPAKFQRWLPILAAQNGIELADDTDNPELLKARDVIQSKKGVALDVSLEAMVSSVALFSGIDDEAIYDWPILKMTHRRQALQRALDYMICGIGEAQGAKWKHGNPVPSPLFPKKKDGDIAAIPMNEFAGGAAMEAVQESMQ